MTTVSRRPVVGAEKVAAVLVRIFRRGRLTDPRTRMVNCNHAPAVVVYSEDRPEGVFLIEITDAAVTGVYAVRNPDKLAAVTLPRRISRS
ncbi:RNA polymerase subunit sigma [Streptomyces eurythermus]